MKSHRSLVLPVRLITLKTTVQTANVLFPASKTQNDIHVKNIRAKAGTGGKPQ